MNELCGVDWMKHTIYIQFIYNLRIYKNNSIYNLQFPITLENYNAIIDAVPAPVKEAIFNLLQRELQPVAPPAGGAELVGFLLLFLIHTHFNS